MRPSTVFAIVVPILWVIRTGRLSKISYALTHSK